jgi:hypothetical protein
MHRCPSGHLQTHFHYYYADKIGVSCMILLRWSYIPYFIKKRRMMVSFCPYMSQSLQRNNMMRSRNRFVVMTTGWIVRIRFPANTKKKFFCTTAQLPHRFCGPPSLLFNEYWGYRGQDLKLTTHLHIVPRSRMLEL